MKVTNLMSALTKRIGRAARKTRSTAGPAILAGGMFFAGAASAEVLFSENFEGLTLMEVVSNSEIFDFGPVWTDVVPAGWVRDNADTPLPDPNDPEVGPEEFFGFTFVDKEWWIATAQDQQRSLFSLGDGVIMVADPDEYDDQAKLDGRSLNENGNLNAPGAMNVFITTPSIVMTGFNPASAVLSFDSSFRPYDLMTGLVDVSFDNGTTWKNLLTLDLDAFGGVNSSLDRVDETIDLNLGAPASATQAKIRFALLDAGNDWWWAIDNMRVTADRGPIITPGDFDNDSDLDVADINGLLAEIQAGTHTSSFDVTGDNRVDSSDLDRWVNDLKKTWFGDANLDGEFNTGDLVQIFQRGKFEQNVQAGWGDGDWTGNLRFDTGDLVAAFQAGGFERGPKAAAAAVPEPSGVWLVGLGALAAGILCGRGRA